MKLRKILAVALAAAMTLSVAACGSNQTTTDNTNNNQGTVENTGNQGTTAKPNNTGATNDEITIGTWWVQYYDSHSESLDEATDWVNAQDEPGDSEADLKTNFCGS